MAMDFMSYLDEIISEGENTTEAFNVNNLSEEDEATIFLEALREECTDDEFVSILKECAYEMASVGLVPSPDVCTYVLEALYSPEDINNVEIATEGIKRIVINDWKHANFDRIHKRTALRMAHNDNFAPAKRYDKYRKLMIQARNEIYAKYLPKAKAVARQIIRNSKRKASNISSPGGVSMAKKMDAQIQKLDGNARNHSAIKK